MDGSNMSKGKWFIVFFVTGCIDLAQIVLDLFAVGVVVNRAIDVFVGLTLPLYFQMNGVSMVNPKRALSMLAAFGLEFVPVIDALPLWVLDVAFIYSTTKVKNVAAKMSPETLKKMESVAKFAQKRLVKRDPLNKDGVRLPQKNDEVPHPIDRSGNRGVTNSSFSRTGAYSLNTTRYQPQQPEKPLMKEEKSSDDEMSLSA